MSRLVGVAPGQFVRIEEFGLDAPLRTKEHQSCSLVFKRITMFPSPAATVLLFIVGGIWIIGILSGIDLHRFLIRTPLIRSSKDLSLFKQLASRQMYAALVMIGLGGFTLPIFLFFLWQAWFVEDDVYLLLGCAVAFWVPIPWVRSVQSLVKRTPVSDGELYAERERIVKIWMQKALPDW